MENHGNCNLASLRSEAADKVGQQRFWVKGGVDHWAGVARPATGTTIRATGVILGWTDPRFADSAFAHPKTEGYPEGQRRCRQWAKQKSS